MILRKIVLLAASIIKCVILFIFLSKSYANENTEKKFGNDKGIVSIMYHRFNENKYPSTNIEMKVFEEQIKIIKDSGFDFYDPKNFEKNFSQIKKDKKILLTIDDAFQSFYEYAWPYLKKEKIPFILFVSTQPVGKNGFMTWNQILEIEKSELGTIGHHSHTHEYLIDMTHEDFIEDIETASIIFKEKLGYVPSIFSYPFGEYSKFMKDHISDKFTIAFGQHSGVIDLNKDRFELPRFPINEKYGDLKRFKFNIDLLPLEYKKVIPENKYITNNNPPQLQIEFFENQKNLKNINCFSDEGDGWKKTDIKLNNRKLFVNFSDKFKFRRGRINCSLNDTDGWRWFGLQFSIKLD